MLVFPRASQKISVCNSMLWALLEAGHEICLDCFQSVLQSMIGSHWANLWENVYVLDLPGQTFRPCLQYHQFWWWSCHLSMRYCFSSRWSRSHIQEPSDPPKSSHSPGTKFEAQQILKSTTKTKDTILITFEIKFLQETNLDVIVNTRVLTLSIFTNNSQIHSR